MEVSNYTGSKFGAAEEGTTGGTVTWSFATLAGQDYTFSSAITQAAYRDAITAAFALWEAATHIDFVYDSSDSDDNDIRLGWDAIDAAGGTVSGQSTNSTVRDGYDNTNYAEIRFDKAEDWTTNITTDPTGVDFFAQAVHQIGRVLGFAESTDPTSVMHPTAGIRALSETDLEMIETLYGEKPVVAVTATEDADVLNGNTAGNTINGLGGGDIINGNDGNDTLNGGADNDVINGGNGNDSLYGGTEIDTINGDAGLDKMWGGDGDDIMNGGNSNDTMRGDAGEDSLYGGANDDLMYGGADDDYLNGGKGADTMYGDDGNDLVNGGSGSDKINGGNGNDSLQGGGGYDVFYFKVGNDMDDIVDFADGIDKIDFSTFDFANFAALKALGTDVEGNLVLNLTVGEGETTQLTIENFSLAQFTAVDVFL